MQGVRQPRFGRGWTRQHATYRRPLDPGRGNGGTRAADHGVSAPPWSQPRGSLNATVPPLAFEPTRCYVDNEQTSLPLPEPSGMPLPGGSSCLGYPITLTLLTFHAIRKPLANDLLKNMRLSNMLTNYLCLTDQCQQKTPWWAPGDFRGRDRLES